VSVDWVFVALVAGSFLAAAFNAAFSIGGAMLILAITTTVLPVSAVVPLHSGLLVGSTVSRAWLFRPFMQGKIVLPFLLGSLFGAAIGTKIYVGLPDDIIAIAVGGMMLVAIWLPEISWRPKLKHPWVVVGFLHSLLSAMFAYGALLHAVVLHTGLERRQIIATMAGCLAGMSVFKIAGYALFGFDYAPYLIVIVVSIAASFLGTAVGKRLSEKLPEASFRLVYRVLVTVTALRLLYAALAGLVA
jgi:uncharacterized membrane protein YfcA